MSERKQWKIQRALGLELPGLGKPGALEKRNYPPGQHGKARKPKVSQFGAQLREKQKLLFHYGIREEELRRFVRRRKAFSRRTGSWLWSACSNGVSTMLCSAWAMRGAWRLQGSWCRTAIFSSTAGETIGSVVLKPGDVVQLSERANQWETTQSARKAPRLLLPLISPI